MGLKKGESPTWKVGRKKVDEKIKYISKSVSLPSEKWDQIEQKAQEQGTTKNKLIANLIMNYLEKN
jgi:ribbon-helix-helix protein, copG family